MTYSWQANRIRRFFNLVAPIYDFFVLPVMHSKIKKAASLLGDITNSEVLDVCTGTGIMALELAERGARVTGIDFSPAMLSRANRKAKNLLPVNFRLMDASYLEFDDNSFDISTICMGLHEMPRPQRYRTLSEMRRVTRHKVLVMDWVSSPTGRFWQLGVTLIERLEGSFYEEFIRSDLEEVLIGCGLEPLVHEEDDAIGIFLCRPQK